MGWSSGTDVARAWGRSIFDNVEDPKLKKIMYQDMIDTLTNEDWDCLEEAEGIDPILDELLQEEYED